MNEGALDAHGLAWTSRSHRLASRLPSLLNGFDKESRPIIYMRPGRGPPPDNDKQVRYLVFLL